MELSALLEKMFIFSVLMIVGSVLARRGTLDRSFAKAASALVLNVFMAAAILNSVLTVQLSLGWAELGRIMLVLCVMQALGYLIAAAAVRFFSRDREEQPCLELLMSMGNSMFIALPIVDGLLGPEAVFYVSLSCIPFNLLIYTYGVWRLKGAGSRLRIKDMLSIPLVVTLLSVCIFLLRIPVPRFLRSLISATAGASMPMSMIVIGATLGSVSLLDAFKNGKLYLVSAVRLILIPLLTWAICRLLTQDAVLLLTAVIVAGCPSAVLVTVLSVQYKRNSVLTAEGTLQNTVLSMATIPLLVWLLA